MGCAEDKRRFSVQLHLKLNFTLTRNTAGPAMSPQEPMTPQYQSVHHAVQFITAQIQPCTAPPHRFCHDPFSFHVYLVWLKSSVPLQYRSWHRATPSGGGASGGACRQNRKLLPSILNFRMFHFSRYIYLLYASRFIIWNRWCFLTGCSGLEPSLPVSWPPLNAYYCRFRAADA